MIANRILDVILTMLAWVVLPVQFVTTLLLGILVSITFGLLLLPISFIWMILFFPLLGASWLGSKMNILRNLIGIIGIPLAVVSNVYACLMPSMGEYESRAAKLMITESWPFTWEFWLFQTGSLDIESINNTPLGEILNKVSRRDQLKQLTIDRLSQHEQLDPNV